MKFLAIAVFVFIIVFLAFEMGLLPSKYKSSFSSDAKANEAVLRQDDTTTDNLPENPREAMVLVVKRMRAIDTSKCPNNFRAAYERHIQAWEGARDQILSEPDGILESLFVGFINGLSGDFSGGAVDMANAREYWSFQIKSTFNEVLAIAIEYGAKTN